MMRGMKENIWPNMIAALPHGMTLEQVAMFFRRSENLMRRRLIEAGYVVRKIRATGVPNWAKSLDWKQPNVDLAEKLGVSRERVRQIRKAMGKPRVEARGRRA
jgi:hypothetical protein